MYQPYNSFQPNNQVIRVTGENGAKAYQMMPNSSVLLLDETAPLVWLAQTDGAGYKTLNPYKIEPYTPEPEPDIRTLISRISALEERIKSYEPNTSEHEQQQPAKSKPAQQTHEREKS